MHRITIVVVGVVLVALVLAGTVSARPWAAGKDKGRADGGGKRHEHGEQAPGPKIWRDMADTAMTHMPTIVRQGAELYCLRLELLREFYGKTEADAETNKLTAKVEHSVNAVGGAVVDMAVDLRQRTGGKPLFRLFQQLRRQRQARAAKAEKGATRVEREVRIMHCGPQAPMGHMMPPPPMPPMPPAPPIPPAAPSVGQAAAGQQPQGLLQGLRRWGAKIRAYHAQFQHLVEQLQLTTGQRIKAKFHLLRFAPSIVRAGSDAGAEAMTVGRLLMQDEIDAKACKAAVGKLAIAATAAVREVVGLAFALKGILDDGQRDHLLANIPLRMMLLR